jgi:hypothetical protein
MSMNHSGPTRPAPLRQTLLGLAFFAAALAFFLWMVFA